MRNIELVGDRLFVIALIRTPAKLFMLVSGWKLFAQHRLIKPKLFGSDHGIRFVSGPLPERLRVCWLSTCPATAPRSARSSQCCEH
jgi:hypothetical protein